jgi:predicted ester cyclase
MATDERTVLAQNKAIVRRYLEEIYRGNYEVLEEVISPEYYADRPPGPPGLTPGARYATGFDALRRAFPDIRINFDAVIAEGDLVALHATLHGTHRGVFRGVPPPARRRRGRPPPSGASATASWWKGLPPGTGSAPSSRWGRR